MATINHGSGADIIVPSNSGTTYRGLAGDDTYIISNSIAANASVTIVDTSGANKIQLVDGLSVKSSKFAADAVQLTLSNGAVVTINGASNFTYDVGGNATTGTSGSSNTLSQFASAMGVATLPSSGSTDGSSDITIANNGVSGSAAPTFTVTKSGSSVDEGSAVTFTITASSAVSADTSFSWTVIGDTNGATVDKAGTSDIDVLSGTATIASGATSTTFDVTASSDSVVEGIEGIKVSVFDSNSTALSTSTLLINNSGSSATSQSFTLTAGVNEFTGGSGNDSFDASTTNNSLNDFDVLDGGAGTDTVVSKTSGAGNDTVAPQLLNVEKLSVTYTNTDVDADEVYSVNLAEATSINSVMNVTSNDDVTFTNLSNMTSVELKSAAQVTTLDYDYLTLAGADSHQHVTLKGTNSTTLVLDDDNPLNSSVLETVTVDSLSVANTLAALTTTNVNTTTLNVTGDKKLTITAALDADIATIDASGNSGGLTLSNAPAALAPTIIGSSAADAITVGAGNVNFSGGAGNDTLTAGTTWNGSDVFDGGDGTDTLVVTADFKPTNSGPLSGSTILAGLSNVERLKMDIDYNAGNGVGEITLDAPLASGINYFDLSNTDDQVLNLNDGYTGATTVKITGDADSDDKIVNTAGVELNIIGNVADIDGDSNSATSITGGLGVDTLTLTNAVDGNEARLAGTADSISGVDKIVIVDATAGADAIIVTGDYQHLKGGVPAGLEIDASSLDAGEVLTLTGTQSKTAMTVTSGGGHDGLIGGTLSDNIDGGAGNDTITATAGNNTLSGGVGNDTLIMGSGADHISGGAGNDQITEGGNLLLTDTIDGGDGTDTLLLGGDIANVSVAAGISNIEVVKANNAEDITITAPIGGASTYNLSAAGNSVLTLSAGYTGDTTVVLTGDATNADKVVNNANVNLTVLANADDIDADTTLTGGSGTDELKITADNNETGGEEVATLAAVTNFETVTVVDSVTAGMDIHITPNLTTLKSVTIDASALDGSTQLDERALISGDTAAGTLNLIGGGGADSLYGGAKNDTIDGGGGADSINGNVGADHLSGGAGNDTFLLDSKAEYTSAVGSDTIDGGAGVDTVTFTGANNFSAAQLATISNTEKWSIAAGSDFTVSDTVLNANPGLVFLFGGSGTLSGGEDTAGAALTTVALNYTGTQAGDMKLIGSSTDDTFTFNATATLTGDDTIDGNAGSDTIVLNNNTVLTTVDGDAVAATIDVDVTGIEKITFADVADGDYNGDGTLTIANTFTGLTLEVDASGYDVDPTNGAVGEVLTINNNDNVALTVTSGAGRDVINDGSGASTINTGAGNDSITAGGGNDSISGGDGVDTINAGGGTDSINAGAGNDVINVTTWGDFKTSGGVETIDGGAGTDNIRFDDSANNALTITAPEISKIYGIESITLDSGTAASSITFGNETFTNNGPTLTINTNDGAGVTTVNASAVSNGAIVVVNDGGNAASDVFTGGTGDDVFIFGVNGLAATDTINGNAGNDTIRLNAADSGTALAVIDFNDVSNVEKVDTQNSPTTGLDTQAVDLRILKNDVDALNAGNLTVDFSGLINPAVAGAKFNANAGQTDVKVNFTVTGSSKADTLTGSAGNDDISAGGVLVADSITGGAGNDTLTGASGNDTLKGGTGNDNINGNAGVDSIDGGAGNDVIDGGDGADVIDGEGGLDTITLGAGLDILEYGAAADSTGATKDIIKDFTQSTINAVTTDTVTAGDSINIDFGTIGASVNTFTLADKGDVENAGLAGAAIDGVMGSFVFADDTSTIYLDYNGDGLLNASDLQITVEGLTSFHSNDINAIVTAGGGGDALTGGNGDDSLTGAAGADTLNGGYGKDVLDLSQDDSANDVGNGNGGNDSITAGSGADTLNGGAGADTLVGGAGIDSLTGGTGDDTFVTNATAVANRDVVADFEDAGAVVGDVIQLTAAETTDGTLAGVKPVVTQITLAAVGNTQNYDIASVATTAQTDVYEFTVTSGNGDLSAATNGSELVKDVASAGSAVLTAAASTEAYIIAYDDTSAYIYHLSNDGTAAVAVGEILLIATIANVTAGALVAEDFILG